MFVKIVNFKLCDCDICLDSFNEDESIQRTENTCPKSIQRCVHFIKTDFLVRSILSQALSIHFWEVDHLFYVKNGKYHLPLPSSPMIRINTKKNVLSSLQYFQVVETVSEEKS